jgi:hypothetical protein
MDKNQTLQAMRAERIAWQQLIDEVGNERMMIQNAVGQWSIKDIVAHLTAWEQRAVAWLIAAQRDGEPTPAPWQKGMSEDEENAWIYNANQSKSLPDVLAESNRVHEELVRRVEAMPEKDLIDPERFKWLGGNSLVDSIAGNSYEHYRDHASAIREWLKMERV